MYLNTAQHGSWFLSKGDSDGRPACTWQEARMLPLSSSLKRKEKGPWPHYSRLVEFQTSGREEGRFTLATKELRYNPRCQTNSIIW